MTPAVLGSDEGLLFLSLDENVEGLELNSDGLVDDGFVLALLDTTDPSAMVLNVGRAVADAATPLRARFAGGDWNVAFLVSEAAQDDFPSGLNDAALFGASWVPLACPGYADTDTSDDVLHFLSFNAWSANPGASPPVNTGLAGAGRVLSVPGWVATLSPESDDGNCSTNGDADTSDVVLRWFSTAAPQLPVTNNTRLLAVASTPGGTQGATDLDGTWIAVVDEAADDRDHDQDGKKDRTLVAWLDPQNSAPWTFDHGTGPGFQSVGAELDGRAPPTGHDHGRLPGIGLRLLGQTSTETRTSSIRFRPSPSSTPAPTWIFRDRRSRWTQATRAWSWPKGWSSIVSTKPRTTATGTTTATSTTRSCGARRRGT